MKGAFRNIEKGSKQYYLYKDIYTNQNLEYVIKKKKQYNKLNNGIFNIKEVLRMMDNFVDPSDPDINLPNSIHAYQTAEKIRKKHPTNLDLQIVGLIHDLGKILYNFGEPSWAIVGDTYVVGCDFSKKMICYEEVKNNKDFSKYDKYGIYKNNCGLDNLNLSFGHDEYLYYVLKNNYCKLGQRYKEIIRYHSFYPWHTENDYMFFMKDNDYNILTDVKYFNSFDLYSKFDSSEITDEIKKYYDNLLDQYFPNNLKW